ncbi:MAG: hypothetical protein AB7E60_07285 [Sphingobium sp.]
MSHHPSPPDLSTRAGRKAHRHAMRMVAVRPRRYGLWLLTLGAMLLTLPALLDVHDVLGWSPSVLGLIACAASVPLLITGVVLRARYHRRMREGTE